MMERIAVKRIREFAITGIYRNSQCYVSCTSYQNPNNTLCGSEPDVPCQDGMVDMAKQEYAICKVNSCGHLKGESKKTYNKCKQTECQKSKIKEAEKAWNKCKKNTPRNVRSGNRVCTKDGHACQTACWTNRPNNNREIPLLKNEALRRSRYNLTLDIVRDTSIANYEFRGNSDRGVPLNNFMAATIGDSNPKSQLALPVCKSEQMVLGDYHNKKINMENREFNRRFPSTCGDWRSNETAEFVNSIGFGPTQALQSDANARNTLTVFAPHVSPPCPYLC